MGVLSGLGGLIAAMARSFDYRGLVLAIPFWVALGLDAVAFVASLVYLAQAYHRQKYMYLPRLKDLEEWEEEFREFNRYVEATGGDVEETFPARLRERIIEAADRNTDNNEYRSGLLHRARLALFAVLICTTAAGVAYVLDQVVR